MAVSKQFAFGTPASSVAYLLGRKCSFGKRE